MSSYIRDSGERLGSGFPIPMRGNEPCDLREACLQAGKFPIPMRGNEVTNALAAFRRGAVSDPHEG